MKNTFNVYMKWIILIKNEIISLKYISIQFRAPFKKSAVKFFPKYLIIQIQTIYNLINVLIYKIILQKIKRIHHY